MLGEAEETGFVYSGEEKAEAGAGLCSGRVCLALGRVSPAGRVRSSFPSVLGRNLEKNISIQIFVISQK